MADIVTSPTDGPTGYVEFAANGSLVFHQKNAGHVGAAGVIRAHVGTGYFATGMPPRCALTTSPHPNPFRKPVNMGIAPAQWGWAGAASRAHMLQPN